MLAKTVFFSTIVILLTVTGCSYSNNDNTVINISAPQDYGNGVLYFDSVDEKFGRSLSEYLKNHPELEVAAMAGSGRGAYGFDVGYWITVKKIK